MVLLIYRAVGQPLAFVGACLYPLRFVTIPLPFEWFYKATGEVVWIGPVDLPVIVPLNLQEVVVKAGSCLWYRGEWPRWRSAIVFVDEIDSVWARAQKKIA